MAKRLKKGPKPDRRRKAKKRKAAEIEAEKHKAAISRRRFLWKAIGLAAAAAVPVATHFTARHYYGSRYPKRIPGIGRFYADRRTSFDFFLGRHTTAQTAMPVVSAIEEAKKKGKPYNVLVVEAAGTLRRKARESKINEKLRAFSGFIKQESEAKQTAASLMKSAVVMAENAVKEPGGKKLQPHEAERHAALFKEVSGKLKKLSGKSFQFKLTKENLIKVRNIKLLIEASEGNANKAATMKVLGERVMAEALEGCLYPAFMSTLFKSAVKNGLYVKVAEEHRPADWRVMEEVHNKWVEYSKVYKKTNSPGDRRLAVKSLASYLLYRDTIIAKTMLLIKKELKAMPEFKEKQIRPIVTLGAGHRNAAVQFDRATTSLVRLLGQKQVEAIVEEAIRISKKGADAIRKY